MRQERQKARRHEPRDPAHGPQGKRYRLEQRPFVSGAGISRRVTPQVSKLADKNSTYAAFPLTLAPLSCLGNGKNEGYDGNSESLARAANYRAAAGPRDRWSGSTTPVQIPTGYGESSCLPPHVQTSCLRNLRVCCGSVPHCRVCSHSTGERKLGHSLLPVSPRRERPGPQPLLFCPGWPSGHHWHHHVGLRASTCPRPGHSLFFHPPHPCSLSLA